jgi:dihydrolipoamide dehydrogenase
MTCGLINYFNKIFMFDYNVIIIGAGPAGSKCALDLAKAGKKVALIEKDAIGGVCLNRGCIPSKSYLYFVELIEDIKKAKRHGIKVEEPEIVWDDVKKRKDMNVKMLGMGLKKTLEAAGIEIIQGKGNLISDHEVEIEASFDSTQDKQDKKTISSENIIIATGTEPLFIPIMPKGGHVISSTEILDLDSVPKSLVIIGGGVTGVEMASVFSTLGTEVTIIERLDTLLPAQDKEITAVLKKSLEKRGCKIYLNTEVLSCKDKDSQAEVVYKKTDGAEETVLVDKALVVIGRKVGYDILTLEKFGIENDGRNIKLNENLQTTLPNIYIIGDAAGRNLTAYGGEREGECVAEHILGKDKKINYNHIPVTVFSHPEVGQIGLTEEQALEQGIEYEIKKSEYASNGKAIIMGEREGMVKIVVEKSSGKVLGVHIIGVHATDLVHQAFIPVMQGMTVSQWLEVIWSHPVLSEVVKTALEG